MESAGGGEARLTRAQLREIVVARLESCGHNGVELEALASQLIETATHRLVFLVGLEADQIGFEIRSLQEFMAAEGIGSGKEETVIERLRAIAPVAAWRNAFLFAAGKVAAEREHLIDALVGLVAGLNEAQEPERCGTKMGSQVALEVLEDGCVGAAQHPSAASAVATIALQLLDVPSRENHVRLASAYHERLQDAYQRAIGPRLAGAAGANGAWTCVVALGSQSVEWAVDLAGAQMDKGSAAVTDVLATAIERDVDSWGARRVVELLPQADPIRLRSSSLVARRAIRQMRLSPDWLEVAVDACRATRVWAPPVAAGVFVGGGYTAVVSVAVMSATLGAKERRLWLSLPVGHRGWDLYRWEGKLLAGGADSSLESQLRLAADDLEYLPNWGGALNVVAWPLAAALEHASPHWGDGASDVACGAGTHGVSSGVGSGRERWTRAGVTEADIDCMCDESKWPFGDDVAECGYPFGIAALSPRASVLISDVEDLLSLWRDLPNGRMRRIVSSCSLRC